MNPSELENLLRDLPRVGTLVKDRGYRQIWRFEFLGKGYYLKFYPRGGFRDRFRRFFRGSPARREFERLQWLQKASIPAPRAVAALMGFCLQDRIGDAVVLQAIEPSRPLSEYLLELELAGKPIPDRRRLAQQIRTLVLQLGRAGLGHEDLHLGNFLLHEHQLYLLDGYAVRKGGLKLRDVMMLAHSCRRYASTTELLRGWNQLGPGGDMPRRNSLSPNLWAKFLPTIWKENRYFGRLRFNGWRGYFFRQQAFPLAYSPASRLKIEEKDWQRILPSLMQQIASDQLAVLKRKPSGDVLKGEIVLAGRPISIVLKRPRKKVWYRYINEIGRGTRAHREWRKSWNALIRGWPTAWPLLLLERRFLGYIVESVIVYETVPGMMLEKINLNQLTSPKRDILMHRTGRALRKIEELGHSHFDAKATNWIVYPDERLGPMPIMIDIDGIRHRRWRALGIQRLLKSMQMNPTYTPADSLALCRGYAPWAKAPNS